MRTHAPDIFRISAVLSISALALTACGGDGGDNAANADEADGDGDTAAPEAAGELEVWVDADRADVLADAASDFEDDTGIAVNLVQQDFAEVRDQFVSQVPTGEGPDIAVGAHDWLGVLVTNGVVAPVELGDAAEDFEDVAIEAWTYDGQVYGVPYSIENIALLRNADLVDQAPDSFDEMIDLGEESGASYPFLVGLDAQTADPYHLYPFQMSFGAPVFGQNSDGSYDAEELTIGNEGGVEFAQWLSDQGEAGTLSTNIDGDLALENFVDGESPFLLTGPWNVPAAEEAGINVEVDGIPAAGDQEAQPFAGVQGFFLSAQSENTLAATTFLVDYVGSPEVQQSLYEVGGRAPALTESFESAMAEDDIVAGFGEVGAEAVPMPAIPEMGAVWDYWGASQAAIINGEGDPAGLWEQMSEDIAEATE
ncbi:sugar ABC transporter substrate-binding protein [Nesterenkonia natronophila]|uniref:Maltose ABC transporter substrate-binding protein n=1 Tax=Nesterenkonia natronophila TaxID=2174932 RepID=A0A3A4F7L8_9MICC|nr:maltose ABC transporter substrate-binding protein [Nesterenkonia natronophila]RJN31257.1 maltose ABC transporter substrate-binding protein [Nesterenkonia natronophila]